MSEARAGAPGESSSVHDVLLILWVALIGADRIDLLGGAGPFLLKPFLALTPAVLGSELLRRHLRRRPIRMTRQSSAFLTLTLLLLAVVAISVFVSPELTKSASRAALLAVDLAGTLTVVIVASDRGNLDGVFERGAVTGLLIFAAFDALQLANLLNAVPDVWRLGSASVDFVASTYGGIVPRLSGTVADQNRAGLVLLFYGWFVGYRPGRGPRWWLLTLAFLLSVATLSRSAAIAGLATFIVLVLERRVRTVSFGFLFVLSISLTTAALTLVASPAAREWVGTALEPFAQRLSLDEGSSREHVMLIGRGIEEGTSSLSRLAIGLGYGSAYTVLQDVFPGNRYASFHSLYVTIFAETGVVGLLCLLLMFGVPLVRGGPYRALVAGAAVFNLFYQAHTDPAFWVILTLAWLTMPARPRSVGAPLATAG